MLLLPRVPSLVQPAGADQALYAYVGTRILDGGLPYRDAWDQKPPAVHFTYAALYALWPHESVVPAADLIAAGLIALMLVAIGRRMSSSAAGITAAGLFLVLGDPTFNRLSGVRIRSQCETFIALAVTAALLLAVTARHDGWSDVAHLHPYDRRPGYRSWLIPLGIGMLLGLAFTFKYNAIVYLGAALFAITPPRACTRCAVQRATLIALGVLVPILFFLLVLGTGGALADLYYATVRYNVEYSGETYAGPWSFVRYLLTFPVEHARVDALWTLGGLGCSILLGGWLLDRGRRDNLTPVLWVAASCLSVAINGSRGLPQYFVQAAPALALSAGLAAAMLWPATRLPPRVRAVARAAVLVLVVYGSWRVSDFDKIPRNAAHDLAYMTGRISRDDHLARYSGSPDAKYVALSVDRLGRYLASRTRESDPVYIFGFSPGAYLRAQRVSASRFFWSRPVLVGFNENAPGYGAAGVLDELQKRSPKYVVLQIHDWAPPPNDSRSFFTGHHLLGPWLRSGYRLVDQVEDYDIWLRNDALSSDSSSPNRSAPRAGSRLRGGRVLMGTP